MFGGVSVDKKSLDELLNTLEHIAMNKSMLPLNLRGWVNALGLYVQEGKVGRWTRLQAGGRLRSYLDAWQEDDSDWQVRKYDQETWKQRFGYLVGPTCNIADYLFKNQNPNGNLDQEKGAILKESIEHFKSTKEWLWLPGVVIDLTEVSMQMAQMEPARLESLITYAEKLRKGSKEPFDWWFLAMLFDLSGRYKDMEDAIKTAYELVCSAFGDGQWMAWGWRQTLGMFYYAAYSNSRGGQGVVVLGNIPSKVTARSLNYTVDEVRALAQKTLEDTYADAKRKNTEQGELTQIEQAIRGCSKQ